jgi:DsbC/DsbD-like thiol-disulfide interchange protein/cytochrome c biogenesis protein CcdA
MKLSQRTVWTWIIGAFVLAGASRRSNAQFVEVGDGGPGPLKAEHLTAELTALRGEIAPGSTLQAGLVLTLEKGWHVYWINAGDSGQPPKIRWTLPDGITAGPIRFPPPTRLPLGSLMDYGYEQQVAFPVELTAESAMKVGKVHLDAHVNWLVCSLQCFPGRAHLGIDLNVVPGPLPKASLSGPLGKAVASLPTPLSANIQGSAIGDAKAIGLTLHTGKRQTEAQFYPLDPDQIDNAAQQVVQPLADGVRIVLQRSSGSTELPTRVHGLVELSKTENYEFTIPVTPGTVPPATQTSGTSGSPTGVGSSAGLFTELALAFLGGVLLNLMPCVFPVPFLKGLALVHSSTEEKHHQRLHGVFYMAGVLISFWVVVGILLVIRAGGRQIGWGFQMQSPGFVAVMAALVFFLGLSLAGQFEIGLTLTGAGNDLARKQGLAGSFFTGVLATVVATPCMAPMLGAAVGFALSQQAAITFLVFTTLALGLALPYLMLTLQPKWTSILPKPGAWMEVLKQLTAVPLFATAIWLAWVYGQLFGADGMNRMALIFTSFLILSIAGWALGRWPARRSSTVAAVALIGLAMAFPLRKSHTQAEVWEPWSPESLAAARSSGNPVFVDFTAAWCLSCQVNEATVLRSQVIREKLEKQHFKLLKADWAQYDPKITADLASVNRSGVPT